MEFSLYVFTEFSDKKKLKIKKEDYRVGTKDLLCKTETVPLSHRATGNRVDPFLNPIHASVISQTL